MPNSRIVRIAALVPLALTLLLVAGCNSKTKPTPENFTQALNSYLLTHGDCLLPDAPRFPFETSDPAKTKQLDALVQSQLLTRATEPAIHASRYTVTPIGARFAPRFCYGHREVNQIVSSTPPAQANGFVETQVTFTYTLKDVPVWARSAAVQAAFPAMAQATTNGGTATRTLAQTMAGWQVPE
jgi:hypothetical protein